MAINHLRIEYIELSELIAYDRNARMHGEDQIAVIMKSIREFGFTNPVLIDADGVLIAGHGRLEAASRLGLKEVPAIRLAGLNEKQIKALRISDNQIQLHSGASWNLDLLAAELAELEDLDFDLDVLGFDDDFLNGLLDEDVEELTDGYSGDSKASESGEKADVMVTIGPYRVTIARSKWDAWETRLRAEVGFDRANIERELLRRIGFH